MWDKLKQHASAYNSAVLTAHDVDGYPLSLRTPVHADDARQELSVAVAPDVEPQFGPASLLFHQHDAQLWNMKFVLVRGDLAHTSDGWVFRPKSLSPSPNALRFILNCRKTASKYLRKRGLARPSVPWEQLKAVKQH